MHEGHAESIAASLKVISSCLLILVESLPKLPKDAKQSIAEMKSRADEPAGDEPAAEPAAADI